MTAYRKLELPEYKCHKIIKAGKITGIDNYEQCNNSLRTLEFKDLGTNIPVTDEWFEYHAPEVGGYFVVYDDGYTSYSPAEAFEKGYTRI